MNEETDLTDLREYIEKTKKLPFAIVILGSKPKRQVLTRQANNGYIITHESHQLGNDLYPVKKGKMHGNFQTIYNNIDKIRTNESFRGFGITESELDDYLDTYLTGEYPSEYRN